MNKIYFVTTNPGKFQGVKKWIEELDPEIVIEQKALDIPEYQSLNVDEVAVGKAKDAWQLIKSPLLIDDGGIFLEEYNNFPGTFSKQIFQCIGLEGFWKLAKENPKGYFLNALVFIDGPDSYQIFHGKTEGTFIKPEDEVQNTNLPYTEIFIPDGSDITFAKMRGTEEEKKLYHRRKSVIKFLQWYKKHSL